MIRLVMIFIIISLSPAKGQLLPGGQVEDYEEEKSKEGNSSAFISINIRSTEIAEAWPLEFGGNIGFINDDNITLGIAIYSNATTVVKLESPLFPGENPFLMYSYGGFSIGYFFIINDYLHLNFSTMLGLGTLSYNYNASVITANIVERDWFYLAEPQASLSIKIYGRYYLNVNAAIRLSADAEFYNITNSEVNGLVVGGGLRIYLY